jgi:hypothetical protein
LFHPGTWARTPPFFVSVDVKGVAGEEFVSVDVK